MALMSSSDGAAPPINVKILRGYGKLLGLADIAHGSRMVALERVGDCEISMFEALAAGLPESPLFWMELFDLRVHASRDSRGCHNMSDAVTTFEDFASQARRLAEPSLCTAVKTAG
ncbi:hypothetical protein [Bradyrhizobium sp.]|jgi:hypothetical protein|uniref:hypothetical protein n=1 Tax=Bradyrhizobium sp. TaxID=376 RepID=UPI002DDDAA6D|nr:hypothetical protein [Bradyrhizobium sp.]HEV2158167.1 hypothetical protein [Bradyrhizobium sp.]